MTILMPLAPALTGPLTDARAQLAEAVELLEIDEGVHRILATPRREMTVSVPLRRDDGSIEVFTE